MKSTIINFVCNTIEKIGNNQRERWSRHGMYQPPRKTIQNKRQKNTTLSSIVLKTLKTILCCALCSYMFSFTIYAEEYSGTIHEMTEAEIDKAVQRDLYNYLLSKPALLSDDIVESVIRIGEVTTGWGPYRAALGQPAEGNVFSSSGSGHYWQDSEGTNGSWSVGVSIAGETLSLSIGYQPGAINGGVFEACPDYLINQNVKLFCRRKYRIVRYAVYRKYKYETGNGTFVRYVDISTRTSYQTKVDRFNAYS